MKILLWLRVVAVVVLMTGCAAMNSLFIHPLEKVHEMHENAEEMRKLEATTNPPASGPITNSAQLSLEYSKGSGH